MSPGGKESERDVIRHNGSVVILAIDNSKNKKDPWIVMERQYRHAANRILVGAARRQAGARRRTLAGAQRELEEETGYRAKKWKPLVEYFASPGFLGESMKVFLAEGLIAGDARRKKTNIELRLVKLSEVLKMIEKGAIKDGKTLSSVLLYARHCDKKAERNDIPSASNSSSLSATAIVTNLSHLVEACLPCILNQPFPHFPRHSK